MPHPESPPDSRSAPIGRRHSRTLLLITKAAITAALIAWLAMKADWGALTRQIGDANVWWLTIAVAFHALAFVASSLRWWILLRYLVPTVRHVETVPSFYLGLFVNNFMPGMAGMDVARVFGMRRAGQSIGLLVASIFVERILGLAVVVAIAAVAVLLWAPEALKITTVTSVFLLTLSGVMVTLIFTPLSDAVGRRLRAFGSRAARHGGELLVSIGRFRAARAEVTGGLFLTFAIQALVVLSYASLGRGLGAEASLLGYFVAVPLVFLLSSLPVSLGGLGVREGSFVAIMIAGGMDQQTAIGISVLFLFQLLLLTLPGGLMLLGSGKTKPHPRV